MHSYRLNVTEDLNQIPASTTPYNHGRKPVRRSPLLTPTGPNFTVHSTRAKANYRAFVSTPPSYGAWILFRCQLHPGGQQSGQPGRCANRLRRGSQLRPAIADRFHIERISATSKAHATIGCCHRVNQLPFGRDELHERRRSRMHPRRLGPDHRDTVGNRTLAHPHHQRLGRPVKHQRGNRGTVVRPDVVSNDFYTGRSRAAVLQPLRIRPHSRGRRPLRQLRRRHPPGTRNRRRPLGVASNFASRRTCTGVSKPPSPTSSITPTSHRPSRPSTARPSARYGPQTAENAGNRTGQAALRLDF